MDKELEKFIMEEDYYNYAKNVGFSHYVEANEIHQLAALLKLKKESIQDADLDFIICQSGNIDSSCPCSSQIEKLSTGEWMFSHVDERGHIYASIIGESCTDLCRRIIKQDHFFKPEDKMDFLKKYDKYLASADLEDEENFIMASMQYHEDEYYISDLIYYMQKDLSLIDNDPKRDKRIRTRMNIPFSDFNSNIYRIKNTIYEKKHPSARKIEKWEERFIMMYDFSKYSEEVMEETMKLVEIINKNREEKYRDNPSSLSLQEKYYKYAKKMGYSYRIDEDDNRSLSAFYHMCQSNKELQDFYNNMVICHPETINASHPYQMLKLATGEWLFSVVDDKNSFSDAQPSEIILANSCADLCRKIIQETPYFANNRNAYLAEFDLNLEDDNMIINDYSLSKIRGPYFVKDILYYMKKDMGLINESDQERDQRIQEKMNDSNSEYKNVIFEIKSEVFRFYTGMCERRDPFSVPPEEIWSYDYKRYYRDIMEVTMEVLQKYHLLNYCNEQEDLTPEEERHLNGYFAYQYSLAAGESINITDEEFNYLASLAIIKDEEKEMIEYERKLYAVDDREYFIKKVNTGNWVYWVTAADGETIEYGGIFDTCYDACYDLIINDQVAFDRFKNHSKFKSYVKNRTSSLIQSSLDSLIDKYNVSRFKELPEVAVKGYQKHLVNNTCVFPK